MEASGSFTQQMLALAVMDLPFKADAQSSSEFSSERNLMKITASTPALVFYRSLKVKYNICRILLHADFRETNVCISCVRCPQKRKNFSLSKTYSMRQNIKRNRTKESM